MIHILNIYHISGSLYLISSKKTIIIKFYRDKDSEKSEIITHDLIKYDSIDCKNLRDSFSIIETYDVIGIIEGQFFSDIVEVSEELSLLKNSNNCRI